MTDLGPSRGRRGNGVIAVKRQRRKEARPSEIIEAAIEVFAERGFGAAKLEEVARRAGVSKGTIFVYFATKNDLFRAVARYTLASNLTPVQQAAAELDRPLSDIVRMLLARAANLGESRTSSIGRLLINEARQFPDLARVWHEEVVGKVLGFLGMAIERGQTRGEVRPGDARLYAFSIMGPMLSGVIFRDVFSAADVALPDLHKLAAQHADVIIHGLLMPATDRPRHPARIRKRSRKP